MKKVLYTITLVLLLAVFAFSAFQVVTYFVESKQQADRFDSLAQIKESARENTTEPAQTTPEQTQETTGEAAEETEPTEETEPQMLPEYAALYEINDDLVGWITISGTQIDYPVMQTPNNPNYYLNQSFDKQYSGRGCIYVREQCDVFEPSDNVTIYGHNMRDGSMFAALHGYLDQETWEENPLIFFDNLYEYHTYKIFAVFTTTATVGEGFTYHRFENAETEEEFDEFIATCKELAVYDTGITPEYGDKIICLSTCEYTHVNGRLVVAAVRIS